MNGGGQGGPGEWREPKPLAANGAAPSAVPAFPIGSAEATSRAWRRLAAGWLRLPVALRATLAGLLLAGLQVALLLPLAPGGRDADLGDRYGALFQHDSYWYQSIMRRGYSSPVPPSPYKSYEISNVAFFPGYPVLAEWLGWAAGLGSRTSLALTAQLAAWLFWSYTVLLLTKWEVPWPLSVAAVAAILAHPAAFFLVAPYSESLFLAAVLGFLYWAARPGPAGAFLAAVHGFGMTAIRITGIPCVATVAMVRPGREGRQGWLERVAVVGFISLLGGLSFFVFCQARFGYWDFYMQTQEAGWGVKAEYFAPFRWGIYTAFFRDWRDPRQLGQLSVALTFWLFVALAAAEAGALRRRPQGGSGWRVRLPFYFCALAIFYVSVAGVASVQFNSMIRYQFCTHLLLVLAATHLMTRMPVRSPRAGLALAAGLVLFLMAGFFIQIHYGSIFMRGGWFA